MRVSVVLGAAVVAVALVALVAAVSELSFERALLLAPVIVISVGAVVALAVVWGKALLEPVRRRRS